jgi:hypothetical protein
MGISLILGTLGWFVVGFGMMTDCTNDYSCTVAGCSPCATTERWINGGGLAQLLLTGAGVGVLLLGKRPERRAFLAFGAAALLALSLLTFVGTTWRALESYCQPGTLGYASSYCGIE